MFREFSWLNIGREPMKKWFPADIKNIFVSLNSQQNLKDIY
jgi:hypothetical protein